MTILQKQQAILELAGAQRYMPIVSSSPGYRETGMPIWYLPESGRIVAGEMDITTPDYSNEVMNVREHYNKKRMIMNGQLPAGDVEGAALAGVSDEWYERVKVFNELWKQGGIRAFDRYASSPSRYRQYGVITGEDFAAIKDVQAEARVLAATPRRHILTDLVTTTRTDTLDYKIFDWTGFDAINEKIGDLTIPFSGKGKVASQTFALDKYAYQYAFSEEFSMHKYDIDVGNLHITNFAGQMEKVKNQRVADLLIAISGTAKASWSASSTPPQSDRDPRPDIDSAITTIFNTEKSESDTVVSNRAIYNAYVNNSYVTGGYGFQQGGQTTTYNYGAAIVQNFAGFNGVRWGIDNLLAASDGMPVFSTDSIVFAQGPTRVADYEDRMTGVKGTINKEWFAAKTIQADLQVRLTGIA